MGLPRAMAPLARPAYRWLAVSLVLSLFASGLWLVSVVWQVVELGGGPGDLSVALTATAVGLLATTLLGGALADRLPQRRILLAVEVTNAVAVAGVAFLSLSGVVEIWQLAAVALVGGLTAGLYYPAYSALVPALVPEADLLAANGIEGFLRPVLANAVGPAVAGSVVAAASPGAALALTALAHVGAALAVAGVPATPLRRELDGSVHPVRGLLADIAEGFTYMRRTPWLLSTLLFALFMVLIVIGPLEVLTPFAIRDRTGGGPQQHALVLAAFGVGGALASLYVASRRLPRRYLTVMNLLWGVGCLPLVLFGLVTELWPMVVGAFVIGATFQGATVIWGTLLQRRVPPALLGRVSSLDFFVSLAFMPVSMALAGPVSEQIGLATTFVVAGTVPTVLAVVAILVARLPADEIAHPLDTDPPASTPALVAVEPGTLPILPTPTPSARPR